MFTQHQMIYQRPCNKAGWVDQAHGGVQYHGFGRTGLREGYTLNNTTFGDKIPPYL